MFDTSYNICHRTDYSENSDTISIEECIIQELIVNYTYAIDMYVKQCSDEGLDKLYKIILDDERKIIEPYQFNLDKSYKEILAKKSLNGFNSEDEFKQTLRYLIHEYNDKNKIIRDKFIEIEQKYEGFFGIKLSDIIFNLLRILCRYHKVRFNLKGFEHIKKSL